MGQDIERRLRELHERYIFEVNQAVEEGPRARHRGAGGALPGRGAELMAAAGSWSATTW